MIFFDAIINEIALLILISDCLWLLCRNTVDFYILVLYLTTLLNSVISSGSFLIDCITFSTSANKDSFIFSFPIFSKNAFYFFFFSYWIVCTSSTMLSRSSENGHPCFVFNLIGKTFSQSFIIRHDVSSLFVFLNLFLGCGKRLLFAWLKSC